MSTPVKCTFPSHCTISFFRCETGLPVQGGVYRRLAATTFPGGEGASDALSMFSEATVLPYVNDLVRGNLCAFMAGSLDEVDRVEVAVMSVLQFLPGMRVAVAADDAAFDAYDRCEPYASTTSFASRVLFFFRWASSCFMHDSRCFSLALCFPVMCVFC